MVDIDEMERGSVPRLLRLIFRDSYMEYAASRPELRLPKPLTVDETRENLRTPPPWREKPKSPSDRHAEGPPAHRALCRAGHVRPLAPSADQP